MRLSLFNNILESVHRCRGLHDRGQHPRHLHQNDSAVGHPAGGQRAPGRSLPINFGVNLLAGGVIKQGFKKTQVSRSAGVQLLQEGATQLWVFQLGGQRASSGLAGYHRAPGTAMRGGGGYTCAPGKEIKHVSSAEEKNERLLN